MTAVRTARILLVQNHSVIATSLAMALRASGFDSVSIADADALTPEAVLDIARKTRADVALLDPGTGDGDVGVALVGPLLALGAEVLLFADTDDPALISAGLAAGAAAIVDRAMSFERLVATLIRLTEGRELMPTEERLALMEVLQRHDAATRERQRAFDALTGREAFVLKCLVDGIAPKQIAHAEGLSISTVRGHIERILAKLDVRSQREALALARAARWPDVTADFGGRRSNPGNIARSQPQAGNLSFTD